MVRITKDNNLRQRVSKKRLILVTTISGILFIAILLILIFVDPILLLANYQLRIANGTIVHEVMKRQIEGPKILIYLCNVTNGDQFLSGEDYVLKVEEIRPFAYQEYRTLEDLKIKSETGFMSYTPNLKMVFLEEESYANPEDVQVVMPSIPLLAVAPLLGKYPYFIRQIFNMMAAGLKSKAFVKVTAYEYLWGYADPWLQLSNTVVPGLIYYNSSGLMDRFYDPGVKYNLELSTSQAQKFQVNKVTKVIDNQAQGIRKLEVKKHYYNNTYEGAVFPPNLTPDTPISIYRHSVCKSLGFQYVGTKMMEYGSEAFQYKFSNSTFSKLCFDEWCPYGLIDLSPCYFDFPFILSKGHFLDADPRLFDRIEGLSPNRTIHDPYFLVDPKIGIGVEALMASQLSLAIGDVSFNPATRRFKNMVVPICQTLIKNPNLPPEAVSKLRLIHVYGPYILLTSKLICGVLSIVLLAISLKKYISLKRNVSKNLLTSESVERKIVQPLINNK